MTNSSLPQVANVVLIRLRLWIRFYVLREGVALVVVLLGALFWGSFMIDWCYFQFSRLELPRWFRATALVGGIAWLVAGSLRWIVLRLFRSLPAKDLALILERRFPELDDRLITAVETADNVEAVHSPVTLTMLRQTIVEATRTVIGLDLKHVFDRRPIRRALITASVLVTSILALAVTHTGAMERWIAGYLHLKEGYWSRETELILRAIIQPGDQVREFTNGCYKHPRGSDLSLQIDVVRGRKTPDQVRLDTRLANGRGHARAYLTRLGDQPFRHTMAGLLEDADLWITGGDFVNPTAYRVQVVQAPEVQSVTLHCLFPEYTGLNDKVEGQFVRTKQQVNGAQTSLPLATDFVLDIATNKPLSQIRMEGDAGVDRWEIELFAESKQPIGTITLKSQDGRPEVRASLPASVGRAIWSSNHDAVTLPFILAPGGATQLPEKIRAAAEGNQPIEFPLPLPPDVMFRVSLEDTDEIQSTTPAKFTINGIVDQPPLVATDLKGIGSSITRKARIPISGRLSDDYGVIAARFEYKVDDNDSWSPREFQKPPPRNVREIELSRAEGERFEVQPLGLSIKQRLTLSVSAQDGCDVGETHRAFGQKYVFGIVSEEELLSMLYTREVNIRKRFEQIINEMKQMREILGQSRNQAEEVTPRDRTAVQTVEEKREKLSPVLSSNADRILQGIRKNAVETVGVATSFGDIREELVNNAAETPQLLERLDLKIITPLRRINETDFSNADSSLGLFKLALEKGTDPIPSIDATTETLDSMIERMQQILNEIRELAKFNEVIEQLKANITALQDLNEETKRKRKENAIKALE